MHRTHLKFASRVRVLACVIVSSVAAALVVPEPVLAQSCENFVGGVCLDLQKKKATKKKAVKKKPVRAKKKRVRKKAVVKPKPVARQVAAAECVTVSAKTVGNANQASVQSTRQSQVILRNNCKKSVVSYVALNTCFAQAVYFDGTQRRAQRTFQIKPGRRKSFVVTRPLDLKSVSQLTSIVHTYQGEQGGYRKYRC